MPPASNVTMQSTEVDVDSGPNRFVDLTEHLLNFCNGKGDGLVNVFVPHATAGAALIELGSGTEDDLSQMLDRWLPRRDIYRHRHGSTGHGADHVLPAIISPSVVIPVMAGVPVLGVWQALVLVDLNVDNPRRRVRFSFISG